MTTLLRVLVLAFSLIALGTVGAIAQTPATPPAGMTQEQFDSLVEAISKSVAEKLKADAKPAGVFGVAAGGEGRGLFVPHLDEADLLLVGSQGLEDSIDPVAGESEDRIDAPFNQAFHQ